MGLTRAAHRWYQNIRGTYGGIAKKNIELIEGTSRRITWRKMKTTPKPGTYNPKGGAPKGNRNAVKGGFHTAANRELRRRIAAVLKQAHVAVAEVRRRLPKRKPGPKPGGKRGSKRKVRRARASA